MCDYSNSNVFLYSLSLEGDFWFVGLTNKRNDPKLDEFGRKWLKSHPEKGDDYHSLQEIFIEEGEIAKSYVDEEVKRLMVEYGTRKVRGGSYSKFIFTKRDVYVLNREIWIMKRCCLRCGGKSHWAGKCCETLDVDGHSIGSAFYSKAFKDVPTKFRLSRRGMEGKRDIGTRTIKVRCPIFPAGQCNLCGVVGHWRSECC